MKSRHKKQQKSKKHFNNYILIALALALALGLIIYKSLLNPTPLQIAEIGSSTGTVTLKLESDKQTLTTGETAQVRLAYSAGNTHLTAVQTDLSFDTTLVELSSPSVDPSFPTAIISPKIENGKLSFALGTVVSDDSGITGNGNVLTFTLKALKPGSPTLNFSSTTLATTKEENANALRSVQNLALSVSAPNASSTPNPSTTNPTPNSSSNTTVCTQVAGKCLDQSGKCASYNNGCVKANICANPITSCDKPTKSHPPSPSPSITSDITPTPSSNIKHSQSPTSNPSLVTINSPTNLRYNCYSNGTRITLRWDTVNNATSYTSTLTLNSESTKQITSTRNETDVDINPNTTYTWKLTAIHNGVSSDPAEVGNIKCNSNTTSTSTPATTATPTSTPAPTPAPTATPKPLTQAINNIFKKSPTPTPTPKPTMVASQFGDNTPSPTPTPTPGSLADIFASPTPNTTPTPSAQVNIITKIFLGWQALFIKIVESITR